MNNFGLGDKVIHTKGNVPRKGIIIDATDRKAFWGYKGTPLAFSGDDHYFEWLDTAKPYLSSDE